MKFLLLIPSRLKPDADAAVDAGQHPTMDYYALRDALQNAPDTQADLLDWDALDAASSPLVKWVQRVAGRDAALALLAYQRRRDYAAIFSNGENVGIPLALLLKTDRRRPGHVMIGHRLSAGKKRLFFQHLRVHRQMERIFVYAHTQAEYARTKLGIEAERVTQIAFHADTRFFAPLPAVAVKPDQACAAGLEWRDYPTLLAGAEALPTLRWKLAAASPWSKHTNETERRPLPANVEARRYTYDELRHLYAESAFVAVPLYENDFQAGVTTLLEAMAMAKPVIVTQTSGQTDVVMDDVNGLTVAPGDVEGWREAITRLQSDAALRERLGQNALRWLQDNATLTQWVSHVANALRQSARPAEVRSTAPQHGSGAAPTH